ncbi:hypothetical protein HZS_1588 [Henneguya salminicola]|nr:hypothetical protein HZS_1588 [Henneguya salminicola]
MVHAISGSTIDWSSCKSSASNRGFFSSTSSYIVVFWIDFSGISFFKSTFLTISPILPWSFKISPYSIVLEFSKFFNFTIGFSLL